MSRRKFRFTVGARVNFADNFPITPGTVTRHVHSLDEPAYRVKWDDGFREDTSENNANVWRESELEAFEVAA